MATAAELEAELVAINTATDEIASDIADLQANAAGGLTAAEATAHQTKLGELSTKLTAIAASHTVVPPTS